MWVTGVQTCALPIWINLYCLKREFGSVVRRPAFRSILSSVDHHALHLNVSLCFLASPVISAKRLFSTLSMTLSPNLARTVAQPPGSSTCMEPNPPSYVMPLAVLVMRKETWSSGSSTEAATPGRDARGGDRVLVGRRRQEIRQRCRLSDAVPVI